MSSASLPSATAEGRVIAWLEQEQDRCYTSAVVVAQLADWIRTKMGASVERFKAG